MRRTTYFLLSFKNVLSILEKKVNKGGARAKRKNIDLTNARPIWSNKLEPFEKNCIQKQGNYCKILF